MNWGNNARLRVEEVSEKVPELPPWLAEQMPFERKMISIGSLKVHYIDDGPKDDPSVPTILFLHGASSFCTMFSVRILSSRRPGLVFHVAQSHFSVEERADLRKKG